MVGGLLRLHGVSCEAQKIWGLRERLGTLATGDGTLLLPGIRAEILDLLDRPEPRRNVPSARHRGRQPRKYRKTDLTVGLVNYAG